MRYIVVLLLAACLFTFPLTTYADDGSTAPAGKDGRPINLPCPDPDGRPISVPCPDGGADDPSPLFGF